MPLIPEKGQFEDRMRAPPEIAAEMMKPYADAPGAGKTPMAAATTTT
jgi:hypothetical protein